MKKAGRPNEYPKALAEIAIEVTRLMMARGEDEQTAMEIGFEITEMIRLRFGGNQLYIPRGTHFLISKRDQEMIKEFNGRNMNEVCEKRGITPRRFYQILQAINAQKGALEPTAKASNEG